MTTVFDHVHSDDLKPAEGVLMKCSHCTSSHIKQGLGRSQCGANIRVYTINKKAARARLDALTQESIAGSWKHASNTDQWQESQAVN